jgi:hypothetical protein
MKKVLFIVPFWLIAVMGSAQALPPVGFSTTNISISARVGASCQESQHGLFPGAIVIDAFAAGDQTFAPTADEMVMCTNGTVFTIKVTSAKGTAVDQVCTASGVSGMVMTSLSSPADTLPYTFLCAGNTDGLGRFTGAGASTPRALGIGVKVLAANARAAMANTDYSDTVTLTISY